MTDAGGSGERGEGAPDGYLASFPPRRWHLALAVACVAGMYLLGVTGRWWPTPDSALYQGLGRSLIRGEGYRFNGRINNDVTPGMPAVLGALRFVFGDGFLAPNAFVALCGLAGLWLAYLTLARLTDRRMALAAALATAACYKYFHYCHLILTDATFSALFWGCAYASVRYLEGSWAWLAAAVGLAVAAVAVRAPGLLILGPLAAGMVVHGRGPAGLRKRFLGGAAVLGGLLTAAGGFYLLARAASDKAPLYASGRLTGTNLLSRLQTLALELLRLPTELSRMFTAQPFLPAGVVFCLLAILGTVDLLRKGSRLSATTVVLFALGSGFLGGPGSIRSRYMMALFPMLLFVTIHGLCRLVELCRRWRRKPAEPRAFLVAMTVLVSCVVAANVPKILRDAIYYSYTAHTGRYYEVLRDGDFADLHSTAAFLRDRFGPDEPIASQGDRVSMLHFLSERRMVRFLKTRRETAAEAEAVYNDLRGRTDVRAVVADMGGAAKPFRRRFDALLSASGAPVLEQGKYCRIYDWSEAGRTSRPASRAALPARSETEPSP